MQNTSNVTYAVTVEDTDASESIGTPYRISVGGVFLGSLEVVGDRDWIAIDLVAGERYNFSLSGAATETGTLPDPYLRLYDYQGSLLSSNDDGGIGVDAFLPFIASTSGTYYMSAGAYSDAYSGTYTLEVNDAAPTTFADLDVLASFLTDGYWQSNGGSRRSFDTSANNVITVDITGLTPDGQQLARWAFEAWEQVADLDFVETTSAADITFDDNASGAYSNTSVFAGGITASTVNISTNWLTSYGTTLDSYAFQTFVHEIGHAIGLGHQGPYNGSATYGLDNTYLNDSWQMSVMSYFSQSTNTNVAADYARLITPMMADIIAVQSLYGAPDQDSATAGNTTYGTNSNLSGYLGAAFNTLFDGSASSALLTGQPVAFTIYDQGGIDSLDLSQSSYNDRINLWHGSFSDVGGLIGNVGIARGTVIENVIGGAGHNTLIGNWQSNYLVGNGGNDTIWAANGDDTVFGGAGDDLTGGSTGADQLWGAAGMDTLFGDAQNDTLGGGADDDHLWGGSGDDLLFGDAGHDVLGGDDGNDTIWAGSGNDTLFGLSGRDILGAGLGDDIIWGGDDNDIIYAFDGNDILYGNTGHDTLWGGDGEDTLQGGTGADILHGGAQNDTLSGGWGGDSFIFAAGFGNDIITDFQIENSDVLWFDTNLWTGTRTVTEVVDLFAVIDTFGSTVLRFPGGDSVTLEGFDYLSGLDSHIWIA